MPGEPYAPAPGETYGYVLGGLDIKFDSCAIEGTYGKDLDYSFCGGD